MLQLTQTLLTLPAPKQKKTALLLWSAVGTKMIDIQIRGSKASMA